MKRVISITICGLLICAMQLSFVYSAQAKSSAELERERQRLEDSMDDIQSSLDEANSAVAGLRSEQGAIEGEMSRANAELVDTLANIDLIQEEISGKEVQIADTQQEYDEAKAQEDALYRAMKERIRFMYEQGEMQYVELLLGASSFADMVNKADYVAQLYEYDRQQLQRYVEAQQVALAYQDRLEEEKSELETERYELQEEQSYLEEVIAEYQSQHDDLDVQLARARQEAVVYKEQMKQQTAQINALRDQIQQKQAEEEAARRAAEEAARARAEAEEKARREAEELARGESASSDGRSESSSEEKEEKKEEKVAVEDRHYDPPGSASGQNIANFACQFVGNPYVAGGTSLTNGADCSGFVYAVYKSFGISVPRTSWELREAGAGVSYEDARPGDVVCYAGHVGIYIGNGCIVHASTAKSGIKISNAAYKTILSVRRFV